LILGPKFWNVFLRAWYYFVTIAYWKFCSGKLSASFCGCSILDFESLTVSMLLMQRALKAANDGKVKKNLKSFKSLKVLFFVEGVKNPSCPCCVTSEGGVSKLERPKIRKTGRLRRLKTTERIQRLKLRCLFSTFYHLNLNIRYISSRPSILFFRRCKQPPPLSNHVPCLLGHFQSPVYGAQNLRSSLWIQKQSCWVKDGGN